MSNTSFTRFALALSLALTPAVAHANGRFPAAQHVVVGPGTQSNTIALRTTFGFAVSNDSGANFHWMCEEFLGYAGPAYDPPVVIDQRNRLELGLFDGLLQVSDDRCIASRIASAEGDFLVDLDVSDDGATVVGVTSTGAPGSLNRVYRSDDGGDTFTPQGSGVSGVLFETLELARGNTQRVYLTAVQTSPREFQFYRSDDGGATLVQTPFPMGTTVQGAFIAAVDPSNPDTVYVRSPLPAPSDGGASTGATALYRTRDAGQTWETVVQTVGPMLGFAISDDGQTLWMGGPDPHDAFQRSDDAGATWHRLSDLQVFCLRQHAGALYVCSNYVLSGYALGRSMDLGQTVTPVLRFEDMEGPFTCPPDSEENSICTARWPRIHDQFVTADAGSATDAQTGNDGQTANDVTPGNDSGTAMDAPGTRDDAPQHAGCGPCAANPWRPARNGAVPAVMAVALGALVVRRRSKRRAER